MHKTQVFPLLTVTAALLATVTAHLGFPPEALCQETAMAVEAKVTVEGRVSGVYQSNRDSLVQILVQKSEIQGVGAAGLASYPAPGEYVYVHVPSGGRGGADSPQIRSDTRVYLTTDRLGQWVPDGRDWYEAAGRDSGNAVARGGGGASSNPLGVTTESVRIGRDNGLRVVSVTPGSPAARAGLETGDVIVQAKRRAVNSQAALDEAYRSSVGSFSLTVRDKRSGRDILVDVDAMSEGGDAGAKPRMQSLGVTTELAFKGGATALKITDVASGSPAQRAGLSDGLLILEANGKSLENPDALKKVELSSRGRLELKVFDPKDGRERTVRVSL